MKPKTIDEALKLVPEYVMLRPGVDVWKKGDEYGFDWIKAPSGFIGVIAHGFSVRRPIPQHVREALAVTALQNNDEPSDITAARIIGRWLAGGEA